MPLVKNSDSPIFKKLRDLLLPVDVTIEFMANKYCTELSKTLLQKMSERPVLPFSSRLSSILDTLRPITFGDNWIQDTALFNTPEDVSNYRAQLEQAEQLKHHLLNEVYGQDHAIEHLIDSMVKSLWQPKQNRPQGLFFFAGPPASGKTFLAERFAHYLRDDYHYKIIDMTQYTNANESFGLVGAKKTYDDSAPGELTRFVEQHPKSVIVFDEFEKAHTQVLLTLQRILSAGVITDEYTQKDVDFRQTIVVFTSNLGSAVYDTPDYLKILESRPEQARAAMISQLGRELKIERDHQVKAIPPELLSRLSQGSIVLFKHLKVEQLLQIVEAQLSDDIHHFCGISGVTFSSLDSSVVRLLLTTFSPFYDIRDIKANVSSKILDPITDFIRMNLNIDIKHVRIEISEDIIALFFTKNCEEHIKALKLRHEVFFTEVNCSAINTVLTITYSKPGSELLVHTDDIDESGGIVLDMPNIGFDDIAGHDLVKTRLKETINIIRHGEDLIKAGISAPKGMVLYGPPGTGKTILARALASEARLPIATCSGNELLSEDFMKSLFRRVRKYAPCILFIDEIDALPKRGEAGAKADALINRLLTEIDGFTQSRAPVFIVAATNRLDKLDDALLRSGRLDLHVRIPFLDKGARRWFIEKFLSYHRYSRDIDVDEIVSLTAGLSGADIEKIHRESVLRALSENNTCISQAMMIEEVNILKYGAKCSLNNSAKTLIETAYHEAGHAVVSKLLMPDRRIEQISIVPREQALGMVTFNNDDDIGYTKAYWFSSTCVALAGRAAQVVKFTEDGLDTGASSDLKKAMWCAWSAIAKYGMHVDSYNIDITALQQITGRTYFKENTEKLIKQWLGDATVKTDELVKRHWTQIEAVAQALLDKEVLSEAQFMSIIG